MPLKLDTHDKKILLILDMHARMPESRIASRLKISKQMVNYRIKRLERQGIIKGYTSVVDHTKIGLKLFKILLKFTNLDSDNEEKIIRSITDHASWAAKVLGNWDVAFAVYAKDDNEFMAFWQEFYGQFGYFIESRSITIMTKYWNCERSFIHPLMKDRNSPYVIGTEHLNYKIDDVDRKILDELRRDARMTSLQIAKKIGETERIVRYRIRSMEKSRVILGYRAFTDTFMLGMKLFKIFINLKDAKSRDVRLIRNTLLQNPAVGYSTETIGGPDFEIEVYLKDSQQLSELISSLRQSFPNHIKSTEFMEYLKEYKFSYYPSEV